MILYNDVLNELQDYILDDKNIQKSLQSKNIPSINLNELSKKVNVIAIEKEKENYKKVNANEILKKVNDDSKKDQLFIPKHEDTLFWCYYIIKNGHISYETLHNKNSLVAKQLKIDLVNTIRKNKDIVKMYKFDTLVNIESNLANDNIINLKTFLTLCAIDNLNIIYSNNKTFYEFLMNDTDIIYNINGIQSQSKYRTQYGFKLANKELIENIKSTLYKLEKIDKPIKSISSYKLEELINICNKLSIQTNNIVTCKKKSKKELYESIIQYF